MSFADVQALKALKTAKDNARALSNMTNRITPNLFDKTNLVSGYYSGTVGSKIVLNGSSTWFHIPSPIAVKAGDTINFNMAFQTYYIGTDDSDNVVQVILSPPSSPIAKTITVASGVTRAYINCFNTYLDNFMVTLNIPVPSFYMSAKGFPTSKWYNKSYVMLGDSITWQDGNAYTQGNIGAISNGYGTLLKNKTGLATRTNYGISGASMGKPANYPTNGCISMDGQTRSFTNVDFVTIFAGTNDFKLNVPLGTLGKMGDTGFDITTFYGAYRQLLEYMLNQKPTLKIYLFTPLQRNNGGYDVNYTNSAGVMLKDIKQAVINIGEMYGIPVLDLYAKSGINALNFSTYLMDGLHPNDLGYARLAELIVPFVENN